ncbi:MAG: hypothetical protein K0S53_989 [Bacteroidetes bacterium]|jgi:uncharacterized membrane protein|nr:hypothetical protein [Bacteroidota bacterium]
MKTNFRKLLYLFTAFTLVLLTYRIFRSGSISYIFLVWNLFLAFIPWWISNYIKKQQLNFRHLPLLGAWLLFIPNAPYILTDLFHLKQRSYLPLWFDLILVLSFALIGMILFLKSLKDMLTLLKNYVSPIHFTFITPVIFWLISFGLYLGRYLRFNSWDIVHPLHLAKASFGILLEKDTIGFTCIFSVFIWFLYYITLCLDQNEKA